MKLFKETRDKAKALGIEVEDISAKLESVELVLNGTVTSRHIRGADALTVVDADSTATACGPYVSIDIISFYTVCMQLTINTFQTLTSWSETLDIYIADAATADSDDTFSSGTWTAKIDGW